MADEFLARTTTRELTQLWDPTIFRLLNIVLACSRESSRESTRDKPLVTWVVETRILIFVLDSNFISTPYGVPLLSGKEAESPPSE